MNFPADWQNKPLGSVILDIGDGGTPNTNKSDYFGGPVPWVVIQDIKKHIISTKTTLTELGLNSCSAKLWPVGAVILSTGATIGEVGIAEVPLATKQGIHGIVCSDELSSEFLYYKLSTLRDFLRANGQGSTIREVRAPFIRTIPIAYPTDKTEQTKVAEVLSTVDRAIEQTEALIAKQQRIKTGLMQDLLSKGIDAHGNIRSEATHAFKDSPLGRIPVEWDVQEIKSLLADIDPAMRSGPFGSALLKEELAESGIPLLGIDNVFPEQFVADYKRFVPPKKAEQLRRYLVRPRDLMITIMGTVGRCCLVPDEIGEALSSKHVWTISIDQAKYSPYVACLQVNHSPWVLKHFAKDERKHPAHPPVICLALMIE
ncbi:MAG: restriction endonuclease subunit S [Burkholderiales bacterium]|nr:restriction endonuclease subunit S [Burkholderiales bacterium]